MPAEHLSDMFLPRPSSMWRWSSCNTRPLRHTQRTKQSPHGGGFEDDMEDEFPRPRWFRTSLVKQETVNHREPIINSKKPCQSKTANHLQPIRNRKPPSQSETARAIRLCLVVTLGSSLTREPGSYITRHMDHIREPGSYITRHMDHIRDQGTGTQALDPGGRWSCDPCLHRIGDRQIGDRQIGAAVLLAQIPALLKFLD